MFFIRCLSYASVCNGLDEKNIKDGLEIKQLLIHQSNTNFYYRSRDCKLQVQGKLNINIKMKYFIKHNVIDW